MTRSEPGRRDARLAVAACAALGGSLIMQQLPEPPGPIAIVGFGLAALGLSRLTASHWSLWLVAGLAWTALAVDRRLDATLPVSMSGSDFRVSGWVDNFPDASERQTRFSFRVTFSERPDVVPGRLRLSWYDAPFEIEPGQTLALEVRLRSPRGLSNPGVYDYERWLFDAGYGATGYVRSGELALVGDGGIARAWFLARAELERKLASAIPNENAAALAVALSIGERHRFAERHWEAFRRTGTSHLVAISGLHVGLVAAFFFWLARRLWLYLPEAIAPLDLHGAAAVSFFCACVYSFAAGFGVPTQRALIMLSVALLAIASRRRVGMTAGLSTAAMFVLLRDPLATASASFWLSFAAVALLWQLAGIRPVKGQARDATVREAVTLQWRLCLGLLPMTAFFFAEVSLVAPLVNLVAIPFVSFGLVPATLAAAAAAVLDVGGGSLALVAGFLAGTLWLGLDLAGQWQFSALPIPSGDPISSGLAMLAVVLLIPIHPLPGRYLAPVALLPLLVPRTEGPEYGKADVTILDVGHGLAIVIETRDHLLLFDTGPTYASGFDSGRDIVIPALREMRNGQVDIVVVSHADNDHAGGLRALMESYPEARVIGGDDVEIDGATRCSRGRAWTWDGIGFEFLHPGDGSGLSGNDGSCVLRVESAVDALLITGDIETAGERSLLVDAVELESTYVVVPHHGSATSSSRGFVAATGASHAIVSAAYGNRWGFPRPEVRQRWEAAGARVVTTAEGGAIALRLGESAAGVVELRREKRRRYWHPRPTVASGESSVGAL
ncbi:MAG TPA: DNA internalization-related competence protein ComEC/Rec2 [Gammaproteobacteria bacterium]